MTDYRWKLKVATDIKLVRLALIIRLDYQNVDQTRESGGNRA